MSLMNSPLFSLHPMCILEEMRLEIRHSMIGPLTLLASPSKKNSASPRATAPKTGSCRNYLFDRVITHLRDKLGKTPMFWYETDFKEIQPGCVTFAWRHGLTKTAIDAARANKAKIMLCPGEHCYLDYPMDKGDLPEVNWGMPVTSLKRVYELDPRLGQDDAFERDFLFGVTGTLWSECMPQPERVYYQAFPRAMALAEVGWTPQARRNYDQFLRRFAVGASRSTSPWLPLF